MELLHEFNRWALSLTTKNKGWSYLSMSTQIEPYNAFEKMAFSTTQPVLVFSLGQHMVNNMILNPTNSILLSLMYRNCIHLLKNTSHNTITFLWDVKLASERHCKSNPTLTTALDI